MIRQTAPYALVVSLLTGCFDAHGNGRDAGPAGDGGRGDGSARDAGQHDAGPRDAPRWDGPEDCREFGGNRRCDERCQNPCPAGVGCESSYGLCHTDWGDTCGPGALCGFDEVCAWTGGADTGACLETDGCRQGELAELPFTCRYSDGTHVATGPPADPCPAGGAVAGLCGGTCGDVDCGETKLDGLPPRVTNRCWGVSDTRAFGLCAVGSFGCFEGGAGVDFCARVVGAPCACAVAYPRPEEETELTGIITTLAACRAYRAAYPEAVECHGEDWELIE